MTTVSASNEQADVREPSDAEVVERSWDEPEAFAVLFDRYAADIHHYVARRLGTGAADDLVAETFLIAFGRRTTYDLRRLQARPWLYGIATTLVARHRRSERRLYRALARTGMDPLPEPVADQVVRRVAAQDQQRLLATALAGLSRADRDVLLLANAAELGDRAAEATAARPDLNPRPHQWIYLETRRATATSTMPYAAVGAGRVTTRFWQRIDAKRFAYEYRGRLHQMRNYQLSSVFPVPTFAYVRRLPTDPQALLARLYAPFSPGGERPYGRVRLSREEQHRAVFGLAADLLRDNLVPPGVQAAIYRALPRIPGVQLQRDAVDAAGRHGVAFARVHDGHVRAEIILDPQTYQYLGWRQIVVKDFVPNGTVNGKRVTLHVAPGTVFDWTARTAAAIVDRPGQRA